MRFLFPFLAVALIIISCSKDNNYESLSEVKEAIPEELIQGKSAVFINEQGEEWTFSSEYKERVRTDELKDGSSIAINQQIINMHSTDSNKETSFLLLGDAFVKANGKNNHPFLQCSILVPFSENQANLEIPFAYDFIESDNNKLEESKAILGKTFTNVYTANYPEYDSYGQLYYNKAFGIIGFGDASNELWVLDRYE